MSRRILIVNHSDKDRREIFGIFSTEYEVLEAKDGVSAITYLRSASGSFSAIILDVSGKTGGYELLKALRDSSGLSHLPVIVTQGAYDETAAGEALFLGASGIAAKPFNPTHLRCLVRNCVALRESISSVALIHHDKLTGLLTREAFFESASRLIHLHEPGYYTLACFDIDNFKIVNDQYGTEKGDEVLRHVANCIYTCVTQLNGIGCRFMADRFAMLYPSAFRDSELVLGTHRAVTEPKCISRPIRIRIGRYIVNDFSISVSAMYDRATLAERSIRGRYDTGIAEYKESMRLHLLHEQRIVTEMYDALRTGQFEPWFQPQYNHATGAVIGAEVLVRWRRAEDGLLISPGEFIPVFERNGFIYELDKYVWEQACVLLRRWIDDGRDPLPVSVNISRQDVFHDDFISVLKGLIEKYRLPIGLLRLEVTESAFAQSTSQIVSSVRELVDLGFTVEIDDFGSGYSSLNTLKDVPATILKLDMGFLSDCDGSQRGGSILESVVRMARWLGMTVIAEGVEQKSQADYLLSIGCCYIQGYYYAAPMPAAEYELLSRTSSKEKSASTLEVVETFDNNAFWDPKSMETLIFNSYVGGAAILEYHNGKTEVIRSNNRLRHEFGGREINGVPVADIPPEDCLDADSLRTMYGNMDEAVKTGREHTCEVRISNLDGGGALYLRCTVRMIARAGDRCLLYCVVFNISELRIAQENESGASDRLRAIMEHVACGITAVAISGNEHKFLFANDKYYEILGCSREEYHSPLHSSFDVIYPDDREMVERSVSSASESGGETIEFRVVRPNGNIIWVRSEITVAKIADIEEPVQLAIFTDTTAEKEADDQLRLLNDMAGKLLARPDAEAGIVDALRHLLDYFGGERAYVFEFDHSRTTVSNTYEICAPGVTCEKDNLQNLPIGIVDVWLRAFDRQNYISISSVDGLDDSRAPEREILAAQNITSLVAAPLKRDGEYIGFIGVDNNTRRQVKVHHLAALGVYMSVLLTRRDLNARISGENQAMLAVMNGIPGGFARMQVLPSGKMIPLYFSDGFFDLVGMNRMEVSRICEEIGRTDDFIGIHPDDLGIVRENFNKLLELGEVHSPKFRIRRGDGSYVWVMIVGKVRKSDLGETLLNIYYSDASEQERAEQLQMKMLDNLPCGAVLYEFDGKKLKFLYLNKRYRELVGRGSADPTKAVVLDTVHPDDRDIILQEIFAAINQHRDAACDLRILFGDGSYHPFHITGRYTMREDGSYYIYAAYAPISDEIMSIQEVLPIALSAMMSASRDFTFVLDKNLRYICCSRSVAQLSGFVSERDVVGKTDYDLFDHSLAEHYCADNRRVIETGEAIIEREEPLPSGTKYARYGIVSKYPLRDALGNIIGVYGVSRDITALRETESRLQLLTESIPGGIAAFEYGAQGFRMLYCNEGFYRFSGYPKDEFISIMDRDPLFFVLEQDRKNILTPQKLLQMGPGVPGSCNYRCHTRDGGYRWFSLTGTISELRGSSFIFNVVQHDITEQKEAEEQLRLSAEEYRLATRHSGNAICRYSVSNHTLTVASETSRLYGISECEDDIPDRPVRQGDISADTAEAYTAFYNSIIQGEREGVVKYQRLINGDWRWIESHFSTLFSDDGKPVSAVVSFKDVTEQTLKEAIYKKWQQSLQDRPPESYTLFYSNLSKNTSYDSVEGSLLELDIKLPKGSTFDDFTREYANHRVFKDDRQEYISTLNSDVLLSGYHRGTRFGTLEYREITPSGGVRWLRRTVELVEYPNSSDIMAYLMYEDIDEVKRSELMTKIQAETDPLTGLLNRKTFSEKVRQLISARSDGSLIALFMLDLDGFKQINDTFGHAAGDRLLIDVSHTLSGTLRKNDMVCRLGGDEFMVCLPGVPNKAVIGKRAKRICSLLHTVSVPGAQVSTSLGVSVCPDDGADFETLYHRADAALYHVKALGKDNYAFYHQSMGSGELPEA